MRERKKVYRLQLIITRYVGREISKAMGRTVSVTQMDGRIAQEKSECTN